MGSQLTKNFNLDQHPCTTGGPQGIWQIYSATRKNRERTPVSIFMLDKSTLNLPASQKDQIIAKIQQEVSTLTRLRHPNLLKILEPLLEDSRTLAFVTEPVEICLGDLIANKSLSSYPISDIDCRLGFIDICKAIQFMNRDAGMVHFSVCPFNIYITTSKQWRLGGMTFATPCAGPEVALSDSSFDVGAKSFLGPQPEFSAPEVVRDGVGSGKADVFSLGCSVYEVYAFLRGSREGLITGRHWETCREVEQRGPAGLSVLPEALKPVVYKMLRVNRNERPDNEWILKSAALQDPFVKTVAFLESLNERHEQQKVTFLRNLSKIISQFDINLMKARMLPQLCPLLKNPALSQYALPNVIEILKQIEIPREDFQSNIWGSIAELTTARQIQAQSMFYIINETALFVKYVTKEQFTSSIIPLVQKGLNCDVPQILEAIMKNMVVITEYIDDLNYIRKELLPKFLQILLSVKTNDIKEAALKSIGEMLNLLDRSIMLQIIIPTLDKLKEQSLTNIMCMNMLNIYSNMGKLLGYRSMAENIIPALLSLLMNADLNARQYDQFCTALNTMMKYVQEKRATEITAEDEILQFDKVVEEEKQEDINEIFSELFDMGGVQENDGEGTEPVGGIRDVPPQKIQKQVPEPKPLPIPVKIQSNQPKPEPIPLKVQQNPKPQARPQEIEATKPPTKPPSKEPVVQLPSITSPPEADTPPEVGWGEIDDFDIPDQEPPKPAASKGMQLGSRTTAPKKTPPQNTQVKMQFKKKAPAKKVAYNSNDFFSEMMDN